MFQVPWFLVELEGDHPKSYQIIHRSDIIDRNESNCKVRFKRDRDQQQSIGCIISASEYRSYVEHVLQEEQAKSNQLGLMAFCDPNTKYSKNPKWFIIQYQKTREQGIVHEVVCKNDLVWTVANGLKTGTGLGEDVFTRDGDVLRLANIIYIAKSYDAACDKLHEIKKRLDGMFFKESRQNGEWFLLQYSTNRSRIIYGIFNRSITLYRKVNKNLDFVYIPHADEDAIIQCVVVHQSADIDKLYECLAHIRNVCFNIEFIHNFYNKNERKTHQCSIPSEEKATSIKKKLNVSKSTSHMMMHPYAANHRLLPVLSIKPECVEYKSNNGCADNNICDKQTKSSIDTEVLVKIINLEKVMFKESLYILNALDDIDATKSALEKELQCLKFEDGHNNTEDLPKFNQQAQTEEIEHIKCLPAVGELYAPRVKFYAEENDKNAPLRLESFKTRLNRIAENQKVDCDILSTFNKILTNVKTDLTTVSDENDTSSIISTTSSSGVSSVTNNNLKRKYSECDFVELADVDNKYPMRIEGEPALVILGSHGTAVNASDFDRIPWSVQTTATRTLLTLVFGNDILSTHTLSGKPSPAFHGRERPLKLQLDPLKTADIVYCVRIQCGVNERAVRASVTTKCADTAKRYKRRNKDKELS